MTHKLTNRELRDIDTALREWGSRTLPSLASDLKVAALRRRYFRGPAEDIQRAQEKLVRDMPLPDDLEMQRIPPAVQEARANKFNVEVLDKDVEIREIPARLKLTEEDLPKRLKNDEDNAAGVANILATLPDWLFELKQEDGDATQA